MRIFVASPSDLSEERERIDIVVKLINQRYGDVVRLGYYRWEDDSFGAHTSFQHQIPDVSEFDLVIGIFWSRIGVPDPSLPTMPKELSSGKTAPHDGFHGDEPFPGGAAYEVLRALEMQKRDGSPKDVYVFRRRDPPMVSVSDRAGLENAHAQWRGVETFFERWFERQDGTSLRAYTSYAATKGQSGPDIFESLLRKVLDDWMKKEGFSPIVWPIEVLGTPFRALKTFDYEHRSIFFGRGRKVRRARDLLTERAEGFSRGEPVPDHLVGHQTGPDRQSLPFLLISGASGAGKSSFMRAGIAPLLVPPGEARWRIALMPSPGASNGGPALALARALFGERGDGEDSGGFGPALPELAQFYEGAASLAPLFTETKPELLRIPVPQIVRALDSVGRKEGPYASQSGAGQSRLLLLVDQLEEIFGPSVGEAEREVFPQLLIELMKTGRIWVVATLRADFYERMLMQPFIMLKDSGASYDLAPPGPDEIEEIIDESARAAGLTYEINHDTGERLNQRLLADAAGQDALPLLEFALDQMFEKQEERGDRVLRFVDYEAIGRLEGAIDGAANAAYHKLGPEEQQELPRILRALVEPVVSYAPDDSMGGKRHFSLRFADIADVARSPAAERLLDALISARVISVTGAEMGQDHPGASEDAAETNGAAERKVGRIRLAHERVIRAWKAAQSLLDDEKNLELLKMHADIERHFTSWIEGKRKPDYLLPPGLPLSQANHLLSAQADEISPRLANYINLSNRRATAKARRLYATGTVVICALSVLLIFAWIYYYWAQKNLNLALNSVDGLTEQMAIKLEDVQGMTIGATELILSRIEALVKGLERDNSEDVQGMTIGAKQLIFSKIEALIKGLERSNSNESRIVEMRAAMHFAKGKMFRRFRVLPKATEEIEKSLNLRKKLYDEAPNDPIRASRYAASLELWGDQLRDLRAPEGGLKMRADEAIVHYREALTLREHLTKEYPDHDRALSWEIGRAKLNARIGDAYKELGQPQHAEDFYRRALAISVPEYLTRQSEDGMDELGWNLRKLGEILAGGASPSSNSSATAEAIEALEGSLCVRRHRYERNPDEIERERDVSFALVGLGRILVLQQRYDDAESHYYEALELRRKFVRSDPDNKEYSRDVFFSYADVSEFEGKRNNWERAYVHAMHALDHLRKYQNIAEEQRVPERMKRLQNQVQEIRSQFGSPPLNDFNNIALSSDALYQQFLFSVTEPISIPERKTRAAALNQNSEDRENRKDCATRIRRAFGSSTAQRIGE